MKSVLQKDFKVNDKEDLYKTVLVKVGQDYHGRGQYDHHTPFGLCEDLDILNEYLDMLSTEEIIDYRDEYGGSILHDMALCDLPISHFKAVLSRMMEGDFFELLKIKDRNDCYVISNTRSLELFKYLLSFTGMNYELLRNIMRNCPKIIASYLSDLINDGLFG